MQGHLSGPPGALCVLHSLLLGGPATGQPDRTAAGAHGGIQDVAEVRAGERVNRGRAIGVKSDQDVVLGSHSVMGRGWAAPEGAAAVRESSILFGIE